MYVITFSIIKIIVYIYLILLIVKWFLKNKYYSNFNKFYKKCSLLKKIIIYKLNIKIILLSCI